MADTSSLRIYTEITPNPATLKFIANKLLINGSADFPTKESANASPFAKRLFDAHDYISGAFFASNFVTITKTDAVTWEEVQPTLRELVLELVKEDVPVREGDAVVSDELEGTEIEKKIQQILQDYVQPAVESDGGAIAYKSFTDGVVTVELRGACSGCPSSTLTLKSGIEALLKRMVPEVKEVVSEAE